MSKQILLLLTVIILIATGLRFYQLGSVPLSMSWDEVSVGYDAWSILQDGKDQWGKQFPIIFQSFGEFKYPLHIYATALSIKAFGLSDFAVRFPSAFLGVVNVLLLFFLARKLTGKNSIALFAALFLAISPWHLQFSRVNWETNFTLLFFFSGFLAFLYGLEKRQWLPVSFVLFAVSIYTYNAAKVFVPLFVAALLIVYFRDLQTKKLWVATALVLFLAIIGFSLINSQLSGMARLRQVAIDANVIHATNLYRLTGDRHLGRAEIVLSQYLLHFSPKFLFISGDGNPRHSIQTVGEFFWFDLLLLPFGLWVLFKKRTKNNLALLAWFALAPVPATIVQEAPHASRAMFAMGGWQIVSALGLNYLSEKLHAKYSQLNLRLVMPVIFTMFIILSVLAYMLSYYVRYPIKYSQDWQYGYTQAAVTYKSEFDKYDHVLVSDYAAQPYIFFLYYLQYSPAQFRKEVVLNNQSDWGFSTVKSFSNFIFGSIDFNNLPKGKSLIFAAPDKKFNNIKEVSIIKNLNGTPALYVYQYEK